MARWALHGPELPAQSFSQGLVGSFAVWVVTSNRLEPAADSLIRNERARRLSARVARYCRRALAGFGHVAPLTRFSTSR